jgi:hypothetical protein
MDLSKVNDKQEILTELRSRQNSKQKNVIKTQSSSLVQLLAMQKKLKQLQTSWSYLFLLICNKPTHLP